MLLTCLDLLGCWKFSLQNSSRPSGPAPVCFLCNSALVFLLLRAVLSILSLHEAALHFIPALFVCMYLKLSSFIQETSLYLERRFMVIFHGFPLHFGEAACLGVSQLPQTLTPTQHWRHPNIIKCANQTQIQIFGWRLLCVLLSAFCVKAFK